jgi:hypothetical protein
MKQFIQSILVAATQVLTTSLMDQPCIALDIVLGTDLEQSNAHQILLIRLVVGQRVE